MWKRVSGMRCSRAKEILYRRWLMQPAWMGEFKLILRCWMNQGSRELRFSDLRDPECRLWNSLSKFWLWKTKCKRKSEVPWIISQIILSYFYTKCNKAIILAHRSNDHQFQSFPMFLYSLTCCVLVDLLRFRLKPFSSVCKRTPAARNQ